jgi:hypothetical protein
MNARRIIVIALILIGILLAVFFGMRAVHSFRRIHDGQFGPGRRPDSVETDVTLIRGWMTIPYVGRLYHVPPDIIFKAIDIPEHGNQDKSIADLNREYYPQQQGIVLEKVKSAVLAHQAPTVPAPPPTPMAPIP